MIDKFYLENPKDFPPETQDEITARERDYLVRWMRGVMRDKPNDEARRAFLSKVHSVAFHHGITYEELMAGL